jgi:hypothetical protein
LPVQFDQIMVLAGVQENGRAAEMCGISAEA